MIINHIEIDPFHHGQRLDNFLLGMLKSAPKSRIYRAIRQGEVRVNKARVKPATRLKQGDVVRVPMLGEVKVAAAPLKPALADFLAQRILFENAHFLVLNKPAGMAVHGGTQVSFSLIHAMRQLCQLPNLALVHRLDRETSGCLLFAKQRSALLQLQQGLIEHKIEKHYWVLLAGQLAADKVCVAQPLKKNQLSSGERMVRIDPQGKPASSEFYRLKAQDHFTLAQVQLRTGRTHQIRVHAAYLNCPVAGDQKYGDAKWNSILSKAGHKRLYLHARALKFDLPEVGELDICAPLDTDFQAVLEIYGLADFNPLLRPK